MSQVIRLKKGFDINLAGKAQKNIVDLPMPDTIAVKPSDFIGLERPKVLVKEGEKVQAGTPIIQDKRFPEIIFASPVSGEIAEVVRGEKRALKEIRILADREISYVQQKSFTPSDITSLSRDEVVNHMLQGGLWPYMIQRPFAVIANPKDNPSDIYISGFDSSPLAPDYGVTLKGEEKYFQAGVDVLNRISEGKVHLSTSADREMPNTFSQTRGIQAHKFSGPHPSGNVGIQIHHIKALNKGDLVWTIKPFAVVALGKVIP